MSALDSDHSYGFALLQPVGGGDLDGNLSAPSGYTPGGVLFASGPFGTRLYKYIQNRHTAALAKGSLMSAVGDVNGKTQITTAGGAAANTTLKCTAVGMTADIHTGGGLYVLNNTTGAGTAPEGESSIVANNSTTVVNLEASFPLSATMASGDTVDLFGLYNSEIAAIGDFAHTVTGVVVGKSGISAGNFGWVAVQGRTPNTLIKAATALTQDDALIADAGRVGPALGTASVAALQIGSAPHVVNADIVTDKTTVLLTLGLGFSPGTVDASA